MYRAMSPFSERDCLKAKVQGSSSGFREKRFNMELFQKSKDSSNRKGWFGIRSKKKLRAFALSSFGLSRALATSRRDLDRSLSISCVLAAFFAISLLSCFIVISGGVANTA